MVSLQVYTLWKFKAKSYFLRRGSLGSHHQPVSSVLLYAPERERKRREPIIRVAPFVAKRSEVEHN